MSIRYWRDGDAFVYSTGIDTRGLSYWTDDGPFSVFFSFIAHQSSHPIQDITVGGWIEAPLYPKISGVISDTSDWIMSSVPPTNDTCEVLLSPLNTPGSRTGHNINYTYQKGLDNYIQIDLTIGLYEGTSLIKENLITGIPYGWTTGSFTLTAGEAGLINDYSNLRIRFTANTG